MTDRLNHRIKLHILLNLYEPVWQKNTEEPGLDFVFQPVFFRRDPMVSSPEISSTDEPFSDGAGRVYRPITVDSGYGTASVGTVLAFNIKNLASTARYFYVVNVAPDEKVNVLYPDPYDDSFFPNQPIQPGESKEIRLRGAVRFEQSGRETVRVISSTLKLQPILFQTRPPTEGVKGDHNPLEKFLLLPGQKGVERWEPTDTWSTTSHTFEILSNKIQ